MVSDYDQDLSGKKAPEPEEPLTNTQLLAKQIMKQYTFVTTTKDEELFCYEPNKGIYSPDCEWLVKQQCRLLLPKIKSHDIEEVIKFIKDSTYIDRSLFDSNPKLINLKNGVLNIHTREFREHSPEQYFLSMTPHNYDPKAQCPIIVKFLHDALKNTNDYITAIELFGYSLYKTAKYEKAVLCVGDGDNGKGTFLKLFERFVGEENACHVSLQDMSNDRFAVANFFGKSVNTFADLPYEKIKYTGNFKMLTSGDIIRGQKKHGQPFYFPNHALLIFSTNKIPQSDDDTYAYFKRWIMLAFEHNFTGPDNNKNLIEEMSAEFSGLLNLALIGLRKLIRDNAFLHIDDIQTVEKNYRKDDPIEAFIMDKCVLEAGAMTICRDLYTEYLQYYKDNHGGSTAAAVDDHVFGMELKRKQIGRKQKRINTVKENVYDGIKIKENKTL